MASRGESRVRRGSYRTLISKRKGNHHFFVFSWIYKCSVLYNSVTYNNAASETDSEATVNERLAADPANAATDTQSESHRLSPALNPSTSILPNPSTAIVHNPSTAIVPNPSQSITPTQNTLPPQNDTAVTNIPKRRRSRGISKGHTLDYVVLKGGKIKLKFDVALGRPNSEDDNRNLVGECGRVARTYTPFKLKSFSVIHPDDLDSLLIRLKVMS